MTPIAIASAAFPNVYLRADGRGVTTTTDKGSGLVNCQWGAGPWELFQVEPQPDGTVAIASGAFPNVYLRLDGRGVTLHGSPWGRKGGRGRVNCQFHAGPWEKFHLLPQPNGNFAIASAAFPDTYLHLDGSGVDHMQGTGSGKVYCSRVIGPWDTFRLIPDYDIVPPPCSADWTRESIESANRRRVTLRVHFQQQDDFLIGYTITTLDVAVTLEKKNDSGKWISTVDGTNLHVTGQFSGARSPVTQQGTSGYHHPNPFDVGDPNLRHFTDASPLGSACFSMVSAQYRATVTFNTFFGTFPITATVAW